MKARQTRQGAALIVALVALAIAGAISASMFKLALHRRQQLQQAERRLQAEWLTFSGFERAKAQLAADRRYTGETWQLPVEEFPGHIASDVTIRVEEVPEEKSQRRIHVRVQMGEAGSQVQRSRQFLVETQNEGDAS